MMGGCGGGAEEGPGRICSDCCEAGWTFGMGTGNVRRRDCTKAPEGGGSFFIPSHGIIIRVPGPGRTMRTEIAGALGEAHLERGIRGGNAGSFPSRHRACLALSLLVVQPAGVSSS